jgi:hypothetical protein
MADFDVEFYKSYYPDLQHLGSDDLLLHYTLFGKNEGRFANQYYFNIDFYKNNPDFDIDFYKAYYPDLQHLDSYNLMLHYTLFGKKEGRVIKQEFDIDFYKHNPDFDIDFYKEYYPDLQHLDSYNLMLHYTLFGKKEGRIENKSDFNIDFYKNNPDFDIDFYKAYYPHLRHLDSYNLMLHYTQSGKNEGRLANSLKFIDVPNFAIKNYYERMNYGPKYNVLFYDERYYRSINNVNELQKYRSQFEKRYHICNKESFYAYYKDFDYEYYKKTYHSTEDISEPDILLDYHLKGKYEKKLYNEKHLIVIYTPPFDIKCGGIVVMHYLAQLINELHHPKFYAKLFMHNNLKYDNVFCNEFASMDDINDNTIVIYPETISGNPLGAKNVVRWILLELGIEMPIDHYKNWSSTDLVYHWEPISSNEPDFKQLTCPFFNNIFKHNNTNIKFETCYLIKKAPIIHKNGIHYTHPSDSINIENLSLAEISDIFNKCKYFYAYDPNTAYILYAAVCGCIPIIHEIEGINEEEYFSSKIYNFNNTIYNKGIVYGYNLNKITDILDNKLNENNEEYYKDLFKRYAEKTIPLFLENITNIMNASRCMNILKLNPLHTHLNAHSILNHIICLDNDILLTIQNNVKIYPKGDKCFDYTLYRLYLSWIYDSINNKKISITSPITNKVIYTDKYFITTNYADNSPSKYSICNYYFENDKILLGLGLGTGNNPQETSMLYMYCIDSNKILYDWINYSYQTFITTTLPPILKFLDNNIILHNFEIMDSKVTTIYGFINNMGHMLFNDYTGLYLIDSFGIPAKIDEVITGPYDIFDIKHYFTQFKHIYINNIDSIDTLNFKIGKGVLFKYGHFHILDNTIDFLKQNLLKYTLIENDYNKEHQLAQAHSDFIKTKYFPIINIVLRKGDFEMNNQIDVISDLINLIIIKYPNAFFYLDGFVKNNKNDLLVGINFNDTSTHVCNTYIDLVDNITKKINTTNYMS